MSFSNVIKDFKDGITSVFKGKADSNNIYKKDGRVPFFQGLAFGLQHIFAMFIANVAPILIVFGNIGLMDASGMTPEAAMFASNAIRGAIFIAGIGTIIQLLLGARLPIVIGTSFTFVGLFCSFYPANLTPGVFDPVASVETYYTIMACIIIGGLFIGCVGPFVKWWGKAIKPIVPAIVVLGIGLSLLSVGANYFLGGAGVFQPDGSLASGFQYYVIVGLFTLIVGILWSLFTKGVWKNLNIIVAMVLGYCLALIFDATVCPDMISTNWGEVFAVHSVTDVFNVPMPVDFSQLIFKPVPIVLTCLIFLVATVEGIGDSSAVCSGGLGRHITDRELGGVLTVDGLSSMLAGMFGSLPLTTFSQNVGIVSQTKMVNRYTIFIGACFLVLCGFFPPLANLLLTIPYCVLGGAILIVFGMIAVTGIKMIFEQGLDEKNSLIVSLSLCLGFGLTLVGEFFTGLNKAGLGDLATIISNPVLNMFIIAMICSWCLPKSMEINFKRKKKEVPTTNSELPEDIVKEENKDINKD